MSIEDKIKEIISDKLHLTVNEITLEKELAHDLGLDSIDVLEVVMEIEDTYGIEIDDNTIKIHATVKDLIILTESYLPF